ncbi:glycosyltransferase [Candidatus Woesebacteria bacterium]|nr:glycosyltransferase [Candidatus Woesebacteria bacterium]
MPNKLPTLTIGIAAYNEYGNLRSLIPTLFMQTAKHYRLVSIMIASDNSHDNTSNLVHEFRGYPVKLILGKTRLGKPGRVNQIFTQSSTDIVVILDADIKLSHTSVIDELIGPIGIGSHMITTGVVEPISPIGLVERIAYAGVMIWHNAKSYLPPHNLYDSEGMIRAFSKGSYKQLHFPPTSAEDTFPYLVALEHGWSFRCQKKAVANYRLPSTWSEYRSQQRRYLTSMTIEESQFSQKIMEKAEIMDASHKLRALVQHGLSNPIYTFAYCLWSIYIRIDLLLHSESFSSKWSILQSTKKVNL